MAMDVDFMMFLTRIERRVGWMENIVATTKGRKKIDEKKSGPSDDADEKGRIRATVCQYIRLFGNKIPRDCETVVFFLKRLKNTPYRARGR
jgi:hypothetical protein